jgi:hypothetical protein
VKKKSKDENENKDKSWVDNYPPLAEWLRKHEARCMWQVPMQCEHSSTQEAYGHPMAYIECYMIPGERPRPFIVEVRANLGGWNIYTELDDNDIAATLEDVERRLGLIK